VWLFPRVYESRLANFDQGLSEKQKAEDPAGPAAVSVPTVDGLGEWGAVAHESPTGLAYAGVDCGPESAGDGGWLAWYRDALSAST
jgi:hypothetical protein